MEGYDGIPGQVAIRVKPLAKECREANEKYVRQTGYVRNNLLTTDWDETDYGELEFYDLYDAFCVELYGHFEPESPDGTERQFEVEAESFEQVLGLHLNVPKETLRANTVFSVEKLQDDGKFRYVSNKIVQGDEQGQAPWYSKRVWPQE